MSNSALEKDLQGLRQEARKISDQIETGHDELAKVNKDLEKAMLNRSNAHVVNDSLIENYQLLVNQKKKELVTLEADIKAAQLTREDMDEGMAERIATGQQAISNAQKVERDIVISTRNLRSIEESVLQTISNLRKDQTTEQATLSSLQESVVSLKQEQDRLVNWLRDKEVLIRLQETLEHEEQELNAGRDHLKKWQKHLECLEHDLDVMKERLTPQYLAAFKRINTRFTHEGSYTKRKTV